MIEIKDLKKQYLSKEGSKHEALNGINLTFDSKGFVVILGKSGSGKSSLLNILGGLDHFEHGEMIIKGKSTSDFTIKDWDAYRNTFVGFVFQEFYIIEEYTVGKNIALALELQGYPKEHINEKVKEILKQVDLEGFINRYPNEISGGQKQRIAIARALIKNPEIILADEPTGNLDSETSKVILDTLKILSKDKLVIMVTHDIDFANEYGDRIIELKDGLVINDRLNQAKNEDIFYDESGKTVVRIEKGKPLSLNIINYFNKLNDDSELYLSIRDHQNLTFINKKDANQEENRLKDQTLILKKSTLPLKHALRLAFISLFTRKIRLILTIFLFVVALTTVGVAAIFSFYDVPKVSNLTFKKTNTKVITLQGCEGEIIDDYCKNITFSNDSEIQVLRNKYSKLQFYKTLYLMTRFDELIDNPKKEFSNLYPFYGISDFHKVNIMEDSTNRLPLKFGEYSTNLNEIFITDHTAEVIIYQEVFPNVSEMSQLIGKTFKNGLIIKGIVETNYAIYDRLKTVKGNQDYDTFLYDFYRDRQERYFQLYMSMDTLIETYYKQIPFEFIYQDQKPVFLNLEKDQEYYQSKLLGTSALPNSDNEIVLTTNALTNLLGFKPNEVTKEFLQEFIGQDLDVRFVYQGLGINKTYQIVGLIDHSLLNDHKPAVMLVHENELVNLVKLNVSSYYSINAILSDSNYANTEFINELEENHFIHNTEFSKHLYMVERITKLSKNIVLGVGLLVTLFTSFLIMTFISTSIVNKQKDIGTLRAIGASGFDVAKIFITEGIMIALLSSTLAVILTIVTSQVINHTVTSKFSTSIVLLYVDFKTIGINFLLAIVVVLLSSFIPIKKLTIMKPINTIKKI